MSRNQLDDEINENFKKIQLDFDEVVVLRVTALSCRNVSTGYFSDWLDTPDPQVYFKCAIAEGIKEQKTSVLENKTSGDWNQTFCFVLPDSYHPNTNNNLSCELEVLLYDEDSFKPDDFLGLKKVDVSSIPFGKPEKKTLVFGSHGEVDIEISKEIRKEPDFRYSLALCDEEIKTRHKRKEKVLRAMRENIKSSDLPKNINEVPNISVIGSGGGYRATIGYAGAMEALVEEGIIDLTTNMYGLSGGGWYLTSMYSYKALDSYEKLRQFHSRLKNVMMDDMRLKLIDIPFIMKYKEHLKWKQELNLPVSFVDFYGFAVGSTLLEEENLETKLSDLVPYVEDGNVPFPLFTAIHVKNTTPASDFHAHLEMTPYEISLPNYGLNMKPETYNSQWYRGCITHNSREVALHFLQGTTGSAFAIQFKQLLDGKITETKADFDDQIEKFRLSVNKNRSKKTTTSVEDDSSDEDEEPPIITKKEDKKTADKELDELIAAKKQKEENNEEDGDYLDTLGELSIFSERGSVLKRTAEVLNSIRGLNKAKQFMLNPEKESSLKAKINTKKRISQFIDSAILCNIPAFSALRPSRNCNLLLALDFTYYESDDRIDYFCLLNTERLAKANGLKFPKVDMESLRKTNQKELHIIEDEDDPECPIVLWFTLASKSFRSQTNYVRQGPAANEKMESVPQGENFNDVFVFGNPDYKTFNVKYSPLQFDRLRELMKFNVKSNINEIKAAIARSIVRRKKVIANRR